MKKQLSFEDFENMLISEPIPSLDRYNMKAEIIACSQKEKLPRYSVRVVFSVLLISIMLFTTVIMAGPNLVRLYKNNKPVFEIGKIDQKGIEHSKVLEEIFEKHNYGKLREDIKSTLKPGEVAWLVIPDAYEFDKYCDIIINPVEYTDIIRLKKESGWDFKLPTKLLSGKHKFERGQLFYWINSSGYNMEEKIAEDLYNEAKNYNKEYAIKKEFLKLKLEDICLNFSNHISFNISKYSGMRTEAFDSDKVEKLQLGNKEALYIREYNELIFVDGFGKNRFTYTIRGGVLSKEELIKLAKSLK